MGKINILQYFPYFAGIVAIFYLLLLEYEKGTQWAAIVLGISFAFFFMGLGASVTLISSRMLKTSQEQQLKLMQEIFRLNTAENQQLLQEVMRLITEANENREDNFLNILPGALDDLNG